MNMNVEYEYEICCAAIFYYLLLIFLKVYAIIKLYHVL